ncbi:MAG: DUF2605 domain-containing protein [Oculatellaceae cyanobacterium Prado106]|jgi:hypothetical protein|nr:DUF2605 domain-containing protein [Oculatellaceae cyanobacterium Prado106]
MLDANLPEPELLQSLLKPLLEDFQYWFERSRTLLESNEIDFLGTQGQADLLERVKQAQQEVTTAQMLFNVTDGQVGLETSILVPWHQLLMECWRVSVKVRSNAPKQF